MRTVFCLLLAAPLVAAGLASFPGAEGFGATTPGGRGGRILLVTNTNDSGPGSFRAAVEDEGPRIVVFRVGGIIDLKRPVAVRHPYLTLAGQTAPGDGICLRNYEFSVATHDVVVRYLRSRAGEGAGQEVDSLGIGHTSRNVVFDHCSASWSVDECFSLSGDVQNVTVQWCIIAEGLNRSVHKKGPHGYGSLARANGPVSYHHNLWAHQDARSPRMGDNYGKPPFPTFDFRNNAIYDYGGTASGLTQGILKINYVANYIKPGPSSRARLPITVGKPSELRFFIADNVWEGHAGPRADNRGFFDPQENQVTFEQGPFAAPAVTTLSAPSALEAVLEKAGATVPVRDAVDRRIVAEVRSGGGRIIDATREVGGWPPYRGGQPDADSDHDGIPDAWESTHGLNPKDPSDAGRDSGNGYAWIERYVNSLVARGQGAP